MPFGASALSKPPQVQWKCRYLCPDDSLSHAGTLLPLLDPCTKTTNSPSREFLTAKMDPADDAGAAHAASPG